jgi:hypothetical protein
MALTKGTYVSGSGLTDIFDVLTFDPSKRVTQIGIYQRDLVSFLDRYITAFNLVLTTLDSDGATDTNYAATLALTNTKVKNAGVFQEDLVDLLVAIHTKFVALTAKLDADTGVEANIYARDYNFTVINRQLVAAGGVIDQGKIVDYLKTVVTKFNGLLAKMDIDSSPSDSPSVSPSSSPSESPSDSPSDSPSSSPSGG